MAAASGGVATSEGVLQADAYVVALGSWSQQLLRGVGISIPVYAVKGYSITVPFARRPQLPSRP
jgi:D-amino-acid dehydrogenase